MLAVFSRCLCRSQGLLALLLCAAPAFAQKAADEETITGTLVEISRMGQTVTLKIETPQKEQKEFKLTGRAELQIIAKADDGFLRPKQFITARPVLVNNGLFAKEFTVHIGKSKPRAGLTKTPRIPGVSTAAWDIAGEIMSRAQDKDYPDYEILSVRAGGKPSPVYLDKGYTVTVLASDPDLAVPGAPVTIQGKSSGGDRFTVSSATITLPKPLNSEEYFAQDK